MSGNSFWAPPGKLGEGLTKYSGLMTRPQQWWRQDETGNSMLQGDNVRRPICRKGLLVAAASLLVAIGGCASTSKMTTGSIGAPRMSKPLNQMSSVELNGAVATYGAAYDKNPKAKTVGLGYASALQMAGRNDQSLAVMQQMAIAHPKDRDVLAAYGKALAAAGELQQALETVRRAQTPDSPDWRLYSAEGAILDQLGQSDAARTLYRKALDIQPNEPSILSNLGMSYILANDLKSAESYLRQAASRPGADSRIRQNLALVVGLQGRFQEAEQIATAELSPEDAKANIAYLRGMLAQQNTWSMLKDKDAKKSRGRPAGAPGASARLRQRFGETDGLGSSGIPAVIVDRRRAMTPGECAFTRRVSNQRAC